MDTNQYVASLLAPFEPQVPVGDLVEQLNRLYHAREAVVYDSRHPEIHDELGPVWSHMLEVGLPEKQGRRLRVLDFGCGTGFEAGMILRSDVAGRVGELVCYDLSPEMLDVCRRNLGECSLPVEFVSDRAALLASREPFDVLVTNALLHHLTDPLATIAELTPVLADDAVWLAGHEPSSRFFKNEQCWHTLEEYERSRKYQKYVTPGKYVDAIRRVFKPDADPAEGTSRAALQSGLVKKKLPRTVVHQAVDCQVLTSPEDATAGHGLDFAEMEKDLAGQWNLVWKKSYNFMGPFLQRDLPEKWRQSSRQLQECFPDDGASFSSIWTRATASGN
ncbi:MAG TPA: class I SAM-dependent methyltransferase [Thermoguttaceae bacterium]|nr:class I SAM-dependent methyltransferase [Thermoguttaceae bacterium]